MNEVLSLDLENGRSPHMASERYVNSDGLEAILAACVKQAIVDYRRGYVGFRMPDAAAFLRSAGILKDDGSIDAHGHRIPAPRQYAGVRTHHNERTPDMEELTRQIQAWAAETFPHQTPRSVLAHMEEEFIELTERRALPEMRGEIADMYILLVTLAGMYEIDVAAAVAEKHAINLGRTWHRDPVTGYHKHD